MDPIIGMLHNTKLERWHPILFLSNQTPSEMVRYKSKNHHTAGFATREEAVTEATIGTSTAGLFRNKPIKGYCLLAGPTNWSTQFTENH